ncbi:MAG: O-antigen ligase family protein [Actinomycetia bacterium]|nr:O-antigen ligase family protein [Actinomycetes bacterium]
MAKKKKSKNTASLRWAAEQDTALPASSAGAEPRQSKAQIPTVAPVGANTEFAPEIGDFSMREMSAEGHFAFWVLLVLIVLVPIAMNFFFTNPGMATADAFDTIKVWVLRIGSLVVLLSWLIDLLKNGGEIRYHKVYFVLAGLLIWIGISTIVSVSPLTAFFGKYRRYDGLWSYLIYAVLFFVTVQYVTTYERIKMVAQALMWSSVVVTFYGLLQAAGIDYGWSSLPFEKFRSFSTYGNPDLLAGFLAFGFFVTLGLVLSEERKSWRVFYWIVLLMNGVVMITAKSRSIWVGAAVGLILAVILLVKQKPRWMKLDFGFSGAVGLGVVAAAVSSLWQKSDVMNFGKRLISIFQFGTGSGQTRFEIWGAALRAIKARPFFGWGSDTFRLVFRRFEPSIYNQDAGYRSVADNVHNFPLQLAAGIGILGMLAFYAIMIWVIVPAVKLCVAPSDKHKGERMIFIGMVAAVVAYNVHLVFGLSLPGASFLLWILLGVLIVPRTKAVVIDPVPWVVPVSIVAVVVALVPAFFAFRFLAADHYYYLAQAYGTKDDNAMNASIASARTAARLNPTIEMYRTQEVTLLSQKTLTALQGKSASYKTYAAQTETAIKKLLALSPYEYDSYLMAGNFWVSMGQQYLSVGDSASAGSYFGKAVKTLSPQVKVMPNGLALRYQYALALQGQGKYQEALKQFRFCMNSDSNFTEAAKAYDALNKALSQASTTTAATTATAAP